MVGSGAAADACERALQRLLTAPIEGRYDALRDATAAAQAYLLGAGWDLPGCDRAAVLAPLRHAADLNHATRRAMRLPTCSLRGSALLCPALPAAMAATWSALRPPPPPDEGAQAWPGAGAGGAAGTALCARAALNASARRGEVPARATVALYLAHAAQIPGDAAHVLAVFAAAGWLDLARADGPAPAHCAEILAGVVTAFVPALAEVIALHARGDAAVSRRQWDKAHAAWGRLVAIGAAAPHLLVGHLAALEDVLARQEVGVLATYPPLRRLPPALVEASAAMAFAERFIERPRELPDAMAACAPALRALDAQATMRRRNGDAPLGNRVLYGPPGTGKTDFARRFAGRHRLLLVRYSRSAALRTKYQNESENNLKRLYAGLDLVALREDTYAIVFFDELEGCTQNIEGNLRAFHTAMLETLDTGQWRRIVNLGATNCKHALVEGEPALLRRFGCAGEMVEVPLPDAGQIASVLRQELAGLRRGHALTDADIASVAARLAGRANFTELGAIFASALAATGADQILGAAAVHRAVDPVLYPAATVVPRAAGCGDVWQLQVPAFTPTAASTVRFAAAGRYWRLGLNLAPHTAAQLTLEVGDDLDIARLTLSLDDGARRWHASRAFAHTGCATARTCTLPTSPQMDLGSGSWLAPVQPRRLAVGLALATRAGTDGAAAPGTVNCGLVEQDAEALAGGADVHIGGWCVRIDTRGVLADPPRALVNLYGHARELTCPVTLRLLWRREDGEIAALGATVPRREAGGAAAPDATEPPPGEAAAVLQLEPLAVLEPADVLLASVPLELPMRLFVAPRARFVQFDALARWLADKHFYRGMGRLLAARAHRRTT